MKVSVTDGCACARVDHSVSKPRPHQLKSATLFFALLVTLFPATTNHAQSGDHMLFGDLTVDESKVAGLKPLTFDVILYSESGVLVSRQPVPSNGRFRFNNLAMGGYQLVIEVEATEVARVNIDLRSPMLKDVRRDISLEWRLPTNSSRAGLISAADIYVRSSSNQRLFKLARDAIARKRYAKAAELLQQIVKSDSKDFQAWTELANTHFLQKNLADAENEYLHALDAHPGFFLALLNLGRLELSQKRGDVATEALKKAVKAQPTSPDANYFLGEAYLQARKGSVAVEYFREALRLDPSGMAEVHLRLALLYHAAGARDKAAIEYQQFLEKRPDYADKKRLQKYISDNKKP